MNQENRLYNHVLVFIQRPSMCNISISQYFLMLCLLILDSGAAHSVTAAAWFLETGPGFSHRGETEDVIKCLSNEVKRASCLTEALTLCA